MMFYFSSQSTSCLRMVATLTALSASAQQTASNTLFTHLNKQRMLELQNRTSKKTEAMDV